MICRLRENKPWESKSKAAKRLLRLIVVGESSPVAQLNPTWKPPSGPVIGEQPLISRKAQALGSLVGKPANS